MSNKSDKKWSSLCYFRLENNTLVGYYVSKSVFDKMRLNSSGNEPALD